MLYVRTEQRPGATTPEHLFIETHDRAVFERWLPEATLPEALQLTLDPAATARADALDAELAELRIEKAAFVKAMQRAVSVVPVTVANELRRIYREHRDGATLVAA
jgi:hypothetical protein